MLRSLKPLWLASALGVATLGPASAGLDMRGAPTGPERPGVGGCPESTLDVYFRAFDAEVSDEAKAVLMSLALAYLSCDVERIEIDSLAVDSVSPDSTPDIAAKRGENLAGLMRLIFLGRTDVVVQVQRAEDAFGPETRRAQVRLVT